MSFMADMTPNQEPVYLANCGDEAWKRIFTRSSGPTRVLALVVLVILLGRKMVGETNSASCETARDSALDNILRAVLIELGAFWHKGVIVSRADGRFAAFDACHRVAFMVSVCFRLLVAV